MIKKQNIFPALMAFLIASTVFLAVLVLEKSEKENNFQRHQLYVLSQLSAIRAKLEGAINAAFYLSHALATHISIHSGITRDEFRQISQELIQKSPFISHLALAQNNVITHIYPQQGNEPALNFDYMKSADQKIAVLKAMKTQKTLITGPVRLVQGGIGFISRSPVYLKHQAQSQYWGLANIVIELGTLLKQADLLNANSNLTVAIQTTENGRNSPSLFFGNETIFDSDPVILPVTLPEGSWKLAACPKAGWNKGSSELFFLKTIGVLFSLLTGLMVFFTFKSEQHYRYSALHDSLTGLANRTLLNDRILQAVSKAKRNQTQIAILFLDLDNFKPINDTHGHKTGDFVLIKVAQRLASSLRDSDTLARVGGDEFIVLLTEPTGTSGAQVVAEKLCRLFDEPIIYEDTPILTQLSVGIALYPDDGETSDALIKKADQNMYQNKRQHTHTKPLSPR